MGKIIGFGKVILFLPLSQNFPKNHLRNPILPKRSAVISTPSPILESILAQASFANGASFLIHFNRNI
jgi:hypothetical protein